MNSVVVDLIAKNDRFQPVIAETEDSVRQLAGLSEHMLDGLGRSNQAGTQLDRTNALLEEMQQELRGVDSQSDKAFRDMKDDAEKSNSSIRDLAASVGSVIAGLVMAGARAAGGALRGFVTDFADAEVQGKKLEAVLEATGHRAGWSAEQMQALALQLQETTRFEADVTVGAIAMLSKFESIRGDIFRDAVVSAADLAEAMGIDITSATQMLGRALESPAEGFGLLKRAGISFTDAQEEVIKKLIETNDVAGAQRLMLDALDNKFGGLAETLGDTFSGKLAKMSNRWGDIGEAIGGVVIPALELLFPAVDMAANVLENCIPWVEALVQDFIGFAKMTAEWLKPAFEFVIDSIAMVWTAGEIWAEKWDVILGLIGTKFQYEAVRIYNIATYYFTEVIPGLLSWFAKNWEQIFADIADFQMTVLINMGENIWAFIGNVKNWLTNNPERFEFKALTEGMAITLRELPNIAERELGAVEAQLKADLERVGGELGEAFGEKMAKNMKGIRDLMKERDKATDEGDAGEVDKAVVGEKKKEEAKAKVKKEAKEKEKSESQSSFEGLEALSQRIQAAAAGLSDGDKQIKAGEDMKGAADKMHEAAVMLVHAEREGAGDLGRDRKRHRDLGAEAEERPLSDRELDAKLGAREWDAEHGEFDESAFFEEGAVRQLDASGGDRLNVLRDIANLLREGVPSIVEASARPAVYA